jgi:gas vesicle protein
MAQKEQACMAGALIGAVAGATIGYLYATDEGARVRSRMAHLFDRLLVDADEAHRLWLRLNEAWSRFEQDRAHPAVRVAGSRGWPPDGAA